MTLRVESEDLIVGWSQSPVVNNLPPPAPLCAQRHGQADRGPHSVVFPEDVRTRRRVVGDDLSFNALVRLRRRLFGFCLQDASMINCFTVAENLRHTLRLRSVVDDLEAWITRAVGYMLPRGQSPDRFLQKYPITLVRGPIQGNFWPDSAGSFRSLRRRELSDCSAVPRRGRPARIDPPPLAPRSDEHPNPGRRRTRVFPKRRERRPVRNHNKLNVELSAAFWQPSAADWMLPFGRASCFESVGG
jgi:hypothetical protein